MSKPTSGLSWEWSSDRLSGTHVLPPVAADNVTRILHVIWAIPCLVLSVILLTATGGHPPGLVFLPVALAVWTGGHVALWGAVRIARYGAALRGTAGRPPISITVATGAAGLGALVGLYLVSASLVTWRGPSGVVESILMVAAWLGHFAALVGLLLRTPWGRVTAGMCCSAWLVVVVFQFVEHLLYGRPVEPLEMLAAVSMGAALATLAARLLFGAREKEHTAPRSCAEPPA